MIDETKSKSCGNCRFYSRYFTLQGTKYGKIDCGDCIRKNNKKRIPNEICEFWEDIAVKKELKRQSIRKTLEKMSERLEQIAVYLENEEEKKF